MVRKTVSAPNNEPDETNSFANLRPSEGEHLFQVVDIFQDRSGDPDIIIVKCEVAEGEELGRTLLNRLNLDDSHRGFFATRLFLKAIKEEYKGNDFEIDTDNWAGKLFYASVVHNGKYANIDKYNFEKETINPFENSSSSSSNINPEDLAWDEKKNK